ncbi:hypothetical protein [Paenibacillus protaetiae]|uniref:Uncharacterized protein n=1 Tax=Paenibacillus protaetiae TaxID=2509456 RepID=A0A4P6EYY4_9BACL|nr:hypothetical protein [Paenibacillus protaetiae]QAY68076.1 hypothetical protein ET464_18585 [Paenibacillus protaetiae]
MAERVTVQTGTYKVELEPAGAGRNFWQGELWEESLYGWTNGSYDFRFTVYYSNGTVKEAVSTIIISGTADELLGVHRVH